MTRALIAMAGLFAFALAAGAAEIHVAVDGKDANPGTLSAPLRTVRRAAELADGSPVRIDADHFGRKRNASSPTPGPFESPGPGRLALKIR